MLNTDEGIKRKIVEDGVVTLSGIIPDWGVRRAVYETALHTEGVVDIKDKLIVKPASQNPLKGAMA